MTCKDCLHFDVCYIPRIHPSEAEVDGVEHDCRLFADRSRYVMREKGEWIHDINNLYGCSRCGKREAMSPKKLKDFCPNCGADMRGENNE